MPLVMNGVIIPENVANAFSFNGSNVTDVFMNGVQVWNQSLFPLVGWSGSSVYNNYGFETSGTLWRAIASGTVGIWGGVNGDGTFTVTESIANTLIFKSIGINTLKCAYNTTYGADVTFTIGSGFTGSSMPSAYLGLETSGGLMRFRYSSSYYGAYISLT